MIGVDKGNILFSPFAICSDLQANEWNIAKRPGYIGEFEIIDDHRGGKVVIQLNGRLNKTGVISPRVNVAVDAIENWVNQLLPARSFGKIILTTSAGIMDHEEARRKHVSYTPRHGHQGLS